MNEAECNYLINPGTSLDVEIVVQPSVEVGLQQETHGHQNHHELQGHCNRVTGCLSEDRLTKQTDHFVTKAGANMPLLIRNSLFCLCRYCRIAARVHRMMCAPLWMIVIPCKVYTAFRVSLIMTILSRIVQINIKWKIR